MLSPRHFVMIPLLAAAVGVFASNASAQQVSATAQTIAVAESGGAAEVQFKVTVTNGGSSAAANVIVVFADGLQLRVGDVAPEGSAVSEKETRTIDVSVLPTRSQPVPVTLKFAVDGVNVELAQTLVLNLGAPAGGQ